MSSTNPSAALVSSTTMSTPDRQIQRRPAWVHVKFGDASESQKQGVAGGLWDDRHMSSCEDHVRVGTETSCKQWRANKQRAKRRRQKHILWCPSPELQLPCQPAPISWQIYSAVLMFYFYFIHCILVLIPFPFSYLTALHWLPKSMMPDVSGNSASIMQIYATLLVTH